MRVPKTFWGFLSAFVALMIIVIIFLNPSAWNIFIWVATALFVAFLSYIMYLVVKVTDKKRTLYICIAISLTIVVLVGRALIIEVPALQYTFGKPMIIKSSSDIEYCLDHKIRNVSLKLDSIKGTSWQETSELSINYSNSIATRTEYYYSIAEVNGTTLLLKHGEEVPSTKTYITVYLTIFDSVDNQVYNELFDKNLFEQGTLIWDTDMLQSKLSDTKYWIIIGFAVEILAVLSCIYIVKGYKRKFMSPVTESIGYNVSIDIKVDKKKRSSKPKKVKADKFATEKANLEEQLKVLQDLAYYNQIGVDALRADFSYISEADRPIVTANISYSYNHGLEEFCKTVKSDINAVSRKNDIKKIAQIVKAESSKIALWNSVLAKYN